MKNLLIGLSFLTLAFNASALTPKELYAKSVSSILRLKYKDKAGKPWGATGFFIGGEGYVLTNNHVVEDIDLPTLVGTSNNKNTYYNFELVYPKIQSNYVKNVDIAVLKVVNIQKNDTFFELADVQEKINVGDDTFWIGNPAELKDYTFSRGYIGKIQLTNSSEDLQVHGVGYHGSSGSPFFNDEGKVIGILCGGKYKEEEVLIGSEQYTQLKTYEGVVFGASKYSIIMALDKSNYFSSKPSSENQIQIPEVTSQGSPEVTNVEKSKNDLDSLIRELKAYTPSEERKLGSL